MSDTKENITFEIKNHPNCRVELLVTAYPSLIQKAQKEALKEINKQVNIPGFRKGKAPASFILKTHKPQVEEKTKEKLANTSFQEALKESKLPILHGKANIQYTLQNFSEEKASFSFQFEVEPTIPKVDPTECSIKEPEKKKIEKKEVDESLRQLLLFYAKWIPVTERGIEEGDFVILDLSTLEEPKEEVFSGTRFEVTQDSMASWMKKILLGAKTADVVEGISEADPELSEEEKKEFQPKKVAITVKKIEKAELPQLEEEFLKQIGVQSKEQLLERLKEMLEKKQKEKEEKEVRDQVNQFFLKIPFDLPSSLIEAEKAHRKKQFLENPKNRENVEKMGKEEREKMEAHFKVQAEEAVRLFYLSRKVIQDEGISVTHKEVEEEAIKSLQAYGPLSIDPKKIPNEFFALALSRIILQRAQDHVIKHNKKT